MSAFKPDDGARGATILITGGAGFIGTNIACRLLAEGAAVRILDSLSRPGSEANLRWLEQRFTGRIEFVRADVRDSQAVADAVQDVSHIHHLAAQVAVTTSLTDTVGDFEINARGTLNVLEAARTCATPPSIVFSSTNKVYGALHDIELQALDKRYVPADEHVRTAGVSETRALEFHSPYGCSKGAAEQYVLDYSRSFGLRTTVLRMSCIYGPHQNGSEDQGWIAHFMRRALADEPVVVYGSGRQVRDVLFVDDLVNAFECARQNIATLNGRAFNIGGGTANTLSILELLDHIQRITQRRLRVSTDAWRIADQRYYVSDIARFRAMTGWRPRVGVNAGLIALCDWLRNASPAIMPPAAMRTSGAIQDARLQP